MLKTKDAFTLIEMILVMAIFFMLVAAIGFSLTHSQGRSSLDSNTAQLISNIKEQQIKSMTGNKANSNSAEEFGVFFPTAGTSYTLFQLSSFAGDDTDVYNSADTNNYTVNLSPNIVISGPYNYLQSVSGGHQVIFKRKSGDLTYSGVTDTNLATFTLQDSSGAANRTYTVTINKYGAISVN